MARFIYHLALSLLGLLPFSAAAAPCRIQVVEEKTGWPVPLVELRTTHQTRWITDNAGLIAFDAPELMGREVWFDVIGHGYEIRKDGFGYRGVRLKPIPGAQLKVEVRRTMIARRLGRLTGAGLFAESQKLGEHTAWTESGVLGCDSVQTVLHRGKLYWFWGDTTLAHYPLGLFDMSGATTGTLVMSNPVPPLQFPLELFRDETGRPRSVAKMPGTGPTWMSGCVSLPDKDGRPRLVGSYAKIRGFLEAYQTGLCAWNEEKAVFDLVKVLWTKSDSATKQRPLPEGHAVRWTDPAGKEWILFGNPLPRLRCPATFEAWSDPSTWEVLQPVEELRSASGDQKVKLHTGSIAWNAYRKRWVTVFMQAGGKPSAFGELWYAESPDPMGPWGPAIKVLTHENYTFYNPQLHPELTPAGSPILLFEGTYTREFADRPNPTPRYDYNQVLYRLDLDDPALSAARTP